MTTLHALLLGIIEGFTEFMPISSTAHMILVTKLLSIPQTENVRLFEIIVQIGAMGAVVAVYFKKLLSFSLWRTLIIAFIPTGFVGFFMYPYLKLLFTTTWIIVATLFLGGIAILLIEKWYKKKYKDPQTQIHEISLKNAFILGCFQALSILPGTSRSGSVIVGGLLLGINRAVITEFTFLLAVPTMTLATIYSMYKNIHLFANTSTLLPIIVGTVASFIVAIFVIKKFLAYIRTRPFSIFGWYRIVLAIIVGLAII